MPLLLISVGVLFAALLFLNNLIKTISRAEKVGFLDLLLAFCATLIPLAAIVANEAREAPEFLIEQIALPLGAGLAGLNLLIVLLEVFRPQRLKGSRGILGIAAGIFVTLSTFTVPMIAVYMALPTTGASTATPEAAQVAQAADPADASPVMGALDPTTAAQATAEAARIRFGELFRQVIEVVVNATHADQDVLIRELETGKPLSQVVTEHGGDVDQVVQGITVILQDSIRDSERRGTMNRLQAALAISNMELLVRIAVNSDINTLGRQLGRPESAPGQPTEPSFSSLLTDLPPITATPTGALLTPTAALTSTPTLAPTDTAEPSATYTATLTHTPRPTETPYPTLERYATRTATPTATLPPPCLASVDYNLRLRSSPEAINAPDNTLATVPYGTTLELFGQSADGLWWYTQYGNQQGWVMGEYMTLSAACDRLPVRR